MKKWDVSFNGTIQKFPGYGGWTYAAVPKKYTQELKRKRAAWGMFPVTVHVGKTTWRTKLMLKKGGDFFVAFKASVRRQEDLFTGDRVTVSFKLE